MREKKTSLSFPPRERRMASIYLNLREEGPSHYAWCYFIVSSVSTSSRLGLQFFSISKEKKQTVSCPRNLQRQR